MDEESIFTAALAISSPEERKAYLDGACGDRADLRRQVEELLRADADAGSFINRPALGIQPTVDAADADTSPNSANAAREVCALLEPCETPGRIGKLGAYEIIEVVGSGGMGTVLRGFDVKLRRIVAVKVLAPRLAASGLAVKRFLLEAQSAAAVHHDHVVTVHAVEDQHRPPFLVMEFVKGLTLQQKVDQEGDLQLKQILRIGAQIAAGLAAAHRQGLIHRDVKPGNILLENGVERVKITDFGLARAADDAEMMAGTSLVAGTPQYMSPEQARGDAVDFRSDLFSLGSVLYTMCAGRPAFRGDSTMAIMRRVCDETPTPLSQVNPQIPDWLAAVVLRLLEKDPAARFQLAEEVATLLEQRLALLQSPPAQLPEPAVQPQSFDRSPAPTAWLLGIAAAVLLPALILFAIGSEGRISLLALFGSPPPAESKSFALRFDASGRVDIPLLRVNAAGPLTLEGYFAPDPMGHRPKLIGTEHHVLQLWKGWQIAWPTRDEDPPTQPPAHLPGQRVHVAGVIAEGESRLYIDGKLQERKKITETSRELSDFFMAVYYAGVIDEVRISSVARYDADFTPEKRFTADRQTLALYHFDEGAGKVLSDASGNGRDGLLVGAAEWVSETETLPPAKDPLSIPLVPFDPSGGGKHEFGPWTQLFNGQDLAGWTNHPNQPGEWTVEDGVLVGRTAKKAMSHLFSTRGNYQDFHLRASVKISTPGDGGFYFRSPFSLSKHGAPQAWEVAIGPRSPGGITNCVHVRRHYIQDDAWFTLDVRAIGPHVTVAVDGLVTADVTSSSAVASAADQAHFALQAFHGTVEFRSIAIRELRGQEAPVLAGPVLLMHFDEADFYEKRDGKYVRDRSGWGNDGLCLNVGYTRDGKFGGGLANGGKGFLRFADSLIAGKPNFTVAGWAKRANVDAIWSLYGVQRENYPTLVEPSFNVFCQSGPSVFTGAWNHEKATDPWMGATVSYGQPVPAEEWLFFAVALQEGGPSKGQARIMLNERVWEHPLQQIGRDGAGPIQDIAAADLDGVIDELAVWDRALSETELRELFTRPR